MKRFDSTVILNIGTDDDPQYCVAIPRFMYDSLGCGFVQSGEGFKAWLRIGVLPVKELTTDCYRLVVFPYHPKRDDVKYLLHITTRLASMPGTTFLLTWFLEQLCQLRLLSTTAVDGGEESTLLEAVYEVKGDNFLYGKEIPKPDDLQTYTFFLRNILSEHRADKEFVKAKALSKSIRKAVSKSKLNWNCSAKDKSLKEAASLWSDFITSINHLAKKDIRFSKAATCLKNHPFAVTSNLEEHHEDYSKSANSERLIKTYINESKSSGPIRYSHPKQEINEEQPKDQVEIPPAFRIEPCFDDIETKSLENLPPDMMDYKEAIISDWSGKVPPHIECKLRHYRCLTIPKSLEDFLKDKKCLQSKQYKPSYAMIGSDGTSGTLSIHLKELSEIHRKIRVEVSETSPTDGVNELALDLFESGLDLRTLSDQFYKGPDGIKHTYEFTADFKDSDRAIHLTDENFGKAILERFPMSFQGDGEIMEVGLPGNLTNTRDILGVECNCRSNPNKCGQEIIPEVCMKCHSNLVDKKDILMAETIGENDRCIAFRRDTNKNNDNFTSIYLTGAGNDSDVLFKKLNDYCRWSSPLATSVADALSDVDDNIGKNVWRPNDKDISQKIAEKIAAKIILRKRKEDKGNMDKWRLLDEAKIDNSIKFFLDPEENKYDFDVIHPVTGEKIDGKDLSESLGGGQSGQVWRIETKKKVEINMGDGEPWEGGNEFALKIMDDSNEIIKLLLKDKPPQQPGFFMAGVLLGDPQANAKFAILMTYLKGYDLEDVTKKRFYSPDIHQIFGWLIKSCEIVKDVWQKEGWIHWDIKPGNLYYSTESATEQNGLYLIDFGLAAKLEISKDGNKTCAANHKRELYEEDELKRFGTIDIIKKDHSGAYILKDGKPDFVEVATTYHVAPEIKDKSKQNTTDKTPVYSLCALICQLLGDSNYLEGESLPKLPEWASRTFVDLKVGQEVLSLKDVVKEGLGHQADRPEVDKLENVLRACRNKVSSHRLNRVPIPQKVVE